MKKNSLGISEFYVLSIALYIFTSLFLTDYFIQVPSYSKEVLITPAIALFLTRPFFGGSIKVEAYSVVYLLFLLFYFLIGLINDAPDKFAIRYYLFPLVIFFVVRHCLSEYSRERVALLLHSYLTIIVIVGLYELFSNYTTVKEMFSYGDILSNMKVGRAYLFFKIPNLAGLTLSALVLFAYISYPKSAMKSITLFLSIIVLTYIFARTSMVALILSIGLYEILCARRNVRILIVTVFAFVVSELLYYILLDEAIIMRVESWTDDTVRLITGFGVGIGFVTVSELAGDYVVFDSDVLRMLYEIGLLGFISFLAFILYSSIREQSKESFTFCCFIIINMTMGDFHSMYPGVAISYICLALLLDRDFASLKV